MESYFRVVDKGHRGEERPAPPNDSELLIPPGWLNVFTGLEFLGVYNDLLAVALPFYLGLRISSL